MSQERTRLFVIVDPTATHQVALVKALLIAKLADCEIHAFLCVHREIRKSEDAGSGPDLEQQTITEAERWLGEQLEACEVARVGFTREVVWNSKWYDAALRSIAKSGCDLVIKSSFHHSKSKRIYSATSDYSLMRNCACPILFVHLAQDWKSDRVLACVDLESTDPRHARLNGLIIRDAQALANIVGMELHVASAYSVGIDTENLPIKGHGQQVDLEHLGQLYDVEAANIVLRQGSTVETLERICAELDPSIVVMGTLARAGISDRLIGNTAEQLLDVIDADLLTVN